MDTKRAPQIFHGKNIPAGSYFLQFPSELFAAINTLLSGNEAKIMLTLLGCPGDGSFCPSSEYMLKMTGIDSRENYFRTRKRLIDKGYIEQSDGELYIDPDIYRLRRRIKTKEEGRGRTRLRLGLALGLRLTLSWPFSCL